MTTFATVGAVLGGLGVALGAFGAHGLAGILAPADLAVFETGVRYQMYHALALVVLGLADTRLSHPLARAAGWLFVLGVVLFSGSLYGLTLVGPRSLGMVTPFGGVALLAGWGCLAAAVTRLR